MKKFRLFLLLLIAGVVFSPEAEAQDGFFSDAQTLRNQHVALGIQPVYYTSGEDVMLNIRGAYGLKPGLTVHGKLGVFRNETYVGAHLEHRLTGEPASALSFALLGGIYSFGDIGLKLSAVLSKQIDPFSIYTGISYEPLFSDPARNPVLIPVGVDIPLISRKTNAIFEADIAVSDDGEAYQSIHFGLNFYL